MPNIPHAFMPAEDAVPPAQMRFTDVRVEPWSDGRRIRVLVQVTPFEQFPNLEFCIQTAGGEEVSRTSIIETAEDSLTFTMHVRSPQVTGSLLLVADILYPELGSVDQRQIQFDLPAPAQGN